MQPLANDATDASLASSFWLHRLSLIVIALDVCAAVAAVAIALALRLETTDPLVAIAPYVPLALIPVIVQPLALAALGLHRREWMYASVRELFDLSIAVVIGSMLVVPIYLAASVASVGEAIPLPRSFLILEPIIFLGLAAASRLMVRAVMEHRSARAVRTGHLQSTLVYGAGNAGSIVARMAASGALPNVRVVGYVDDDPRKRGSRLLGHRVFGNLSQLRTIADRTEATQLLVAIPSAKPASIRRAVDAAQAERLVVKIVPPLRDLVSGGYVVGGIRAVRIEDLLGREPIAIDLDEIRGSINGGSVVVSGGGGSIGSELVRQILMLGPRLLTVIEHHEWALWNLERDVAARFGEPEGTEVVTALADVRSQESLAAVLERARPDVFFHAAALKHVPYVEAYPTEGVLTNVLGTRNALQACEAADVSRFVLISTDKAVEPVSVMGWTKRLAEQLTVAAGHRTGRAYAAVRFGNVLGSSGSVVPLLQRQLDDGLPLTITEPSATRYFMTIGEAVSLILEAGANPAAGDVYVLNMGVPVRIVDLARDLVRLNGLDPDRYQFVVTGLRPGERLHEKLFYDDETPESTRHPGIMRVKQDAGSIAERRAQRLVEELEAAARRHDDHEIRAIVAASGTLMRVPTRAAGVFNVPDVAS